MIVFDDRRRRQDPHHALRRLREGMASAQWPAHAIQRREVLVRLLIEAGEIAQGLLDAEAARRRLDDVSEIGHLTSELSLALAVPLVRSLDPRPRPAHEPLDLRPLDALLALVRDETIECTVPEGYAFYALYPELYALAARRAPRTTGMNVIGVRSIGASLAPVVAAVTGGRVWSVRPRGSPFARELRVGEALERALLAGRPDYAIVDEGPGLSGSSFGAVAAWLEDRGISSERLTFFPGHDGDPGPFASPRVRARWRDARRFAADFESAFIKNPRSPLYLARWIEDLTGRAEGPLEDIGAGRWRAERFVRKANWPAAHVQQERRKYLVRAGGRTWLLKFVGLGPYGEPKLDRARFLSAEGLTPKVLGLRHGFLVEEWVQGAAPLDDDVDREALVEHLARYLTAITRAPGVPTGLGASPGRLLEMASYNTERALGAERARLLAAFAPQVPRLTERAHPVATDNRMQRWEWLKLPDGRFLKTDALDHHAAHDLVGPQDIAWDIAGAIAELSLSRDEQAKLGEALARRGGPARDPQTIAFYLRCYLAFQVGYWATAMLTADRDEAPRLRRAHDRYAVQLERLLTS